MYLRIFIYRINNENGICIYIQQHSENENK